ncbi:MAG: hypothetical protein MJA84_10010 [Firmicutes bacterium]|nr:hypothetical protein [Bacillota bacterium]
MGNCNQSNTTTRSVSSFARRLIFRKIYRVLKKVLIALAMIFSPFVIWVILSLNRELIVVMANWDWLSGTFPRLFDALGEHVNTYEFARGFNEAALGGLLTLYGVIVTVWYYQMVRAQEVTEKRLFVIDELLEELKKNRHIVGDLNEGKVEQYKSDGRDGKQTFFDTEAWHKLGGDVALLPRRLYLRLSVLYGCLNRCAHPDDYLKNKAVIDRIAGIVSDLHRYRCSLSRPEIS